MARTIPVPAAAFREYRRVCGRLQTAEAELVQSRQTIELQQDRITVLTEMLTELREHVAANTREQQLRAAISMADLTHLARPKEQA